MIARHESPARLSAIGGISRVPSDSPFEARSNMASSRRSEHEHVPVVAENDAVLWQTSADPKRLAVSRIGSDQVAGTAETDIVAPCRPKNVPAVFRSARLILELPRQFDIHTWQGTIRRIRVWMGHILDPQQPRRFVGARLPAQSAP